MGFRLKIDGSAPVELKETSIKNVKYESDSPMDSNARATDFGASLKIWGKMLTNLGGEEQDSTINLAKWSLVPSEMADCYRKVDVEVISASQVVRQYSLPHAFVVEYKETLDDENGVGEFYLHVKQKKDQTLKIAIEGGFGGE